MSSITPLPVITFADMAVLGYGVEVHCSLCCHQVRVDPEAFGLSDRPFIGSAHFRCTYMRNFGSAHPRRCCNGIGHLYFKPADADRVLPRQSIPYCSIACPRCAPTGRSRKRGATVSRGVRCSANPVCGWPARPVRVALSTQWSGDHGAPFTEGYRRSDWAG